MTPFLYGLLPIVLYRSVRQYASRLGLSSISSFLHVLLGAGTLCCAFGKENVQDILWLPHLTGWCFHPVHLQRMKFTNNRAVHYFFDSINEFDTLTTRVWSWQSFARMKEPQNLTQLVWVELCKAATVCIWTAYQCAKRLFRCLMWIWEAVWDGCCPQQWHYAITLTPQAHKWSSTPKSELIKMGITV